MTVTVAVCTTGGLTPSDTVRVATTVASSLQVRAGVNVAVPVAVQPPPGSVETAKVHPIESGSPSGSVAEPVRFTGEPSVPAYVPPALTVGAPFTTTVVVALLALPSLSLTVTVTV